MPATLTEKQPKPVLRPAMAAPAYNSIFSPLATHPVPHEHPRLFGSRARLQALAKERPDAYRRTVEIARNRPVSDPKTQTTDFGSLVGVASKLHSLAMVSAIEEDAGLAREAIALAFERFIDRPIQIGHVPFGADIAHCAIVYDLCHEHWTDEEKKKFHAYFFATRDANVDEEASPFHDGWWGYKNWGLILGCLAVMYETEKELFMLSGIDREFRAVAVPALELAGRGGGYGEGYYVNYYIFEWLLACEAMRHCLGANYYDAAATFYKNRAVAQMFEWYPGIRERGSRRPICVGDGRGRFFRIERDRALAATHLLTSFYRNDPDHQAVAAFNQSMRIGADECAWIDLLANDPTVKKGNLKKFRLSHFSPGPGYVYARSSWEEDATYFFFKCGKRFTSHQHMDVGHFYIYKHEELAGEGGHYDTFGGSHDANYYLRTIAHNSVLVHDPAEKFEFIRGYREPDGSPLGNDGGQEYRWPGTCFRHNGDALDAGQWRRHPELGDIADMTAFEDRGAYVYCAGDATRAYSKKKLDHFTRQIVYLRPGTFVIFDRVKSKNPAFKKTWLLHAMKPPSESAEKNLVITNGKGRLFMQTVLPLSVETKLNQGPSLYSYGGKSYPPKFSTGPEAECRIEVSPAKPAREDYFLHVLTATEASVESVPQASAKVAKGRITLTLGKTKLEFSTAKVGGSITVGGRKRKLTDCCPE